MKAAFQTNDATRSALMRRVRRSRTSLEDRVAALLRETSARYRRNVSSLPGSPDFANRSGGWAIQVNGCFWHGHKGCSLARVPTNNREQWEAKLEANRQRDRRKLRELRSRDFRVLTIWQCQLKDEGRVVRALTKLVSGESK